MRWPAVRVPLSATLNANDWTVLALPLNEPLPLPSCVVAPVAGL